jgi:AraC family transcriptional regulator, positive regulator of tynA and feaB
MNPAPPYLDFEAWKDQVRKMGGRFDPQVIDPKSFAGWVRPVSVYGLMAAEVGSNAHVVERTHRDVRVNGPDHYVSFNSRAAQQ